MRSSEQVDQLTAAVVAAQAKFPVIAKSHTARVPTKSGGEYSYRYADLEDVVTATRPVLVENGLSVRQYVDFDGTCDLLVTRLAHVSGQWEDATMRLSDCPTPQAQGSAITYAKRYAYCAALNIVADEDDDANSATRSGSTPRSHTRPSGAGADPATGEVRSGGQRAASDKQLGMIRALGREAGLGTAEMKDEISGIVGREVAHLNELTSREASAVIDKLKAPAKAPAEEDAPPADYVPNEEPF